MVSQIVGLVGNFDKLDNFGKIEKLCKAIPLSLANDLVDVLQVYYLLQTYVLPTQNILLCLSD